MKKKGFTLIELLAVVIILGIVGLVSTPIIIGVMDDAKKEANRQSVNGLISAARNYYIDSLLDNSKKTDVENVNNIYEKVSVSGYRPENGELYVTNEGNVALSVVYDGVCYSKTTYGELQETEGECGSLGFVGIDEVSPKVTYEIKGTLGLDGWYKRNEEESLETQTVKVKITTTDLESGIENFSWCLGNDCTPDNVVSKVEDTIEVSDTPGTQLCVIAKDKNKNESAKECIELKVDTVLPSFSGISDITVSPNTEVNLIQGVEVNDITSGIEGNFKVLNEENIEITEVDTTKTGTTLVTYKVTDKAGNEKTIIRKIIVSAEAPTIVFTPTGVEKDWAKEDFYVTIDVTDNTGHGLKEFRICTTTKDECDPSTGSVITGTTASRLISTESNNNRICVQAIDNSGQENNSTTICSDAYKLDKTAPVAGTINITGTTGENDWYTSDVTIEVIEGSDALSGHLSTETNITSIKENTEGTVVIVTTKDKAGNTSSREYTIKVDKTKPEVTITEPSIDGENGWYVSKPTITSSVSDTYSGFSTLKWCLGIDCEPIEEIAVSSKSVEISDTVGTQLCVIGIDKAGNASEKKCSNVIKVDTVLPSFSGISDITTTLNGKVDLTSGVIVSDTTSKINGTYTYNPTSVDTTKAGVIPVTYSVKDNAGNEKTITRKVTISTTAPTITYTAAEGAINENGWAKSDFYVTINVSDNSGHGIKTFNVCTATTDTCDPTNGSVITGSTSATRLISTENSNNRICVQATDNYNQTSEVICSDAYKLDKTVPTAGTILVNGSSTIKDWYGTDVTIETVNGTDSLSGHSSTTVNRTGISSNTEGTDVIVTTKDLAGNTSSRNYTIKVDKTNASCSFSTLSYVGVNKTATIELTCTSGLSSLTDKTLTASDFTTNNNNITITSVSRNTITDGYKYTLTVKGVTAGSSTITLPAGKVSTEAEVGNVAKTSGTITVTSVSLNSTSGTMYAGGSSLTSTITSSNAGTLTCTSSNESLATCSISGTTLTIKPGSSAGTATITVKEANGNATATYTATNKVTSVALSSTSGTLYVGGSSVTATISGDNRGTLSCTSSNESLATCSISETTLTIVPKAAGNATITVKEANGNKTATYSATVKTTSVNLASTSGTVYVGGTSITTTISGENYGGLSCSSNISAIATCSISGTTLTMTPGTGVGTTDIIVTEANGNKTATYTITNKTTSVSLASTSGTLYVGGSNKNVAISGSNYGTLSCESNNTSVATCTISGTTLAIVPKAAGSATITVKEGNGNKTATYAATVKATSVALSSTTGTTYVGGSNLTATISGSNYGTLTCTSSNESVATCSISGTTLTMTPGSTAGSTVITVKEGNGNKTASYTLNNMIANYALTATYTATEGAINSNGWAKNDFYVTVTLTDTPGTGLKSFNLCTATTNTCDPSTGSTITDSSTASRLISTENANNRICIQATDSYGRKSSVICSDAYKLDKTVPTAGTITVNGSSTINTWYTSNVTIAAVNGSDALSQHASTTVNTTSITSNTTGTVVTVTTTDLAGNSATRNYTIKVDKNQPTCTFGTLIYVGVNKTTTIDVTCTNTISGMSDKTLAASDFTLSNSNISITSVSKTAVTNGYKYTLTVKGVTAGSSTITLPAGKVSTVAGLSNTAKTSGSITVTSVALSSTSGTLYVGGSNATTTISGSNYGTLSCTTSNSSYATCSISGTTLTITPKAAGTATITVTGSNGAPAATYTATVKATSVSLGTTSETIYVGGSNATTTISGSNYGTLTCTTSNSSYATCSISGTTLTIKPGSSAGTATITVKEANGNKTATYSATVKATSVSLASTSGTIYVGGSSATTTISGSNYGTLTCTTSNSSYATCSISGTTLTITPKAAGSATITVKESNGNKTTTYTATIKATSVSLNSTSGTTYGSNLTATISGSNYGTLSCTTSNSSYATCSISGTTLTIKPGSSSGTATITVKEANGNKTATYTATNKVVTLSLSSTSGISYNGGQKTITISGSNYGTLSCTSSDPNIATCSISGTTLTIVPKTNGTVTITVSETNASKTAIYSLEIKSFTMILLDSTGTYTTTGTTNLGDGNVMLTVSGTNFGTLSCASSDTNIATCSISGTTLTITPISVGITTITVTESNINYKVNYALTVEENSICRRATTLHTEICNQSSQYTYCGKAGYSVGDTIIYGNLGQSGTLSAGDAFDCDVNGDGKYDSETERFYYVSDYYNTTTRDFDSDYAVLIYYNNTTNGVSDNTTTGTIPYSGGCYSNIGPKEAILQLPTVDQWSNINLINTTRAILSEMGYGTTNYQILESAFSYSGYASRLLTYQEVNKYCANVTECEFLLENTKYSNESTPSFRYWLETASDSSEENVYTINTEYLSIATWGACSSASWGDVRVRPVIEVPKTDISY